MNDQRDRDHWYDEEGNELTHHEFVMKNVSPKTWEELGIYPVSEDYVEYGIFMQEAELFPDRECKVRIGVNRSQNTVSLEALTTGDHILFASYLLPVKDLSSELLVMKRALQQRYGIPD